MKGGSLTIKKLGNLYKEAIESKGANGCCWRCGRKATLIYFSPYGILGFACGYHPWKKRKKGSQRYGLGEKTRGGES